MLQKLSLNLMKTYKKELLYWISLAAWCKICSSFQNFADIGFEHDEHLHVEVRWLSRGRMLQRLVSCKKKSEIIFGRNKTYDVPQWTLTMQPFLHKIFFAQWVKYISPRWKC
jgi:hypothetical protein